MTDTTQKESNRTMFQKIGDGPWQMLVQYPTFSKMKTLTDEEYNAIQGAIHQASTSLSTTTNQTSRSVVDTQKESWETLAFKAINRILDDERGYHAEQIINYFKRKRSEDIKQALFKDREETIQLLEKEKTDEAWLARVPDVVREAGQRTNELIDGLINRIKEK